MKQVRIRIIDTETNTLVEHYSSTDVFETEENLAAKASILLTYEGSDDKYVTLMSSSLTFDLLVPDAQDGKFFHLFTGDEKRFKVELSDENDALVWQGYLLPDQYSEPYKGGAFFVSMTATDCVGILRGKELESDYYLQEKAVISIIANALKATGLNQDIYFAPAIEAVNGYRWDETYVDTAMYIEESKRSDIEFTFERKRDSAYDILESLIHDLGCKLYTYKGKWYIVGINQQHKTEINFYRYTYEGVYVEIVKVQVQSKAITFYDNPTITVVSPWAKVEVSADLEEDNTLVDDQFYEEGESIFDPIPDKNWTWVDSSKAYVPRDGKWIYTYSLPGQIIPVVNMSKPWNIGVSNNFYSTTTRGSYMELKKPWYIEKPNGMFELKYLDFELAVVSYSDVDKNMKDRFEKNEFANVMRYELLFDNEVLYSNFPESPLYAESAFELRFSEFSLKKDEEAIKDRVFINTKTSLTGKIKKDKKNITKSGWLQIRIHPPALLNPKERTWQETGITKLSLKLRSKKTYNVKKIRPINYSTHKSVELRHIDNSQDNTKKRFLFKRGTVPSQKAWQLSWKRHGVVENFRYGDCFARMVHDVQPKAHIKIDGDAIGILSPTMLYDFKWMEQRKFIPVRLELNFSEAKTAITMIENVYENVKDHTGIFG